MNMERFFASLTQWGISIHLDDNGAIRVKGKKEKLTATVVAQLKANKTQIAQWLAQTQPSEQQFQLSDKQSLSQAQIEAFEQLTLHGLFEVQLLEHSEREAVHINGISLSYGQLNLQANRLAYYLRQQGLEAESCVAIAMKLSVNSVVAILAVLKAGGSFLPIDNEWPEQQLHSTLKDGEVCRIVTDNHYLSEYEFLPIPVDNIDDQQLQQQLLECAGVNPPLLETQSAFSLATILVTPAKKPIEADDGQLGKGVMLEHGHLLAAIKYSLLPELNHHCCWPLNFPLHSRFGLMSLFMALCHGGKVVQFQPLLTHTTRQISHLAVDGRQLGLLLHHNQSLIQQVKHLFIVGHQFEHQLLLQLLALRTLPSIRLYGVLEAGFFVSSALLNSQNPLSLGEVNKGCFIHLLDQDLTQVESGQQGQIYISGIGVSRGYSEGWQLTEQYFIPSPFSDDPNEHLFASDDVAIANAEGELTFIARNDGQTCQLPTDWSQAPEDWQLSAVEQLEPQEVVLAQQVWHNEPFSCVAQQPLQGQCCYVVFVDSFGIGAQLAKNLRRQQLQVVEVRVGEQFALLHSGIYQLNPDNSTEYRTLFNYLYQLGTKRCIVVHCWSLTSFELNASCEAIFERLARIEQINRKALDSVVAIVDGVSDSEIECQQLNYVSHDLFSVSSEESLLLSACGIKGLLGREGLIPCYHLDLCFPSMMVDENNARYMAQFISYELTVVERPKQVALRGKHRWLAANRKVTNYQVTNGQVNSATLSNIAAKHLLVLSDDAKAVAHFIDGLLSLGDDWQIVVLSDEVEVINGTWPEQVECLHTLLGDFASIERRFGQVNRDLGMVDSCVFLPAMTMPFTKQVKTVLTLESLFSVYKVQSCVLLSPLPSVNPSLEVLKSHYYQQLFVQRKFHDSDENFSCIGFEHDSQLSHKTLVTAMTNPQTPYVWASHQL